MPSSNDWFSRPAGERQALRSDEPPSTDDRAGGEQAPRAKWPGPLRGLASRWLYLSIPLGVVALTLSIGSGGDHVLFPSWQRLIFAVLIVALGAPRLRTAAFTLLILAFALAWILRG
jgi:hypothetical protein